MLDRRRPTASKLIVELELALPLFHPVSRLSSYSSSQLPVSEILHSLRLRLSNSIGSLSELALHSKCEARLPCLLSPSRGRLSCCSG